MLNYIGTDIISTIDPRSKGRIERLWRTFKDRLYKELKKKNINTIEKSNQCIKNVFLPKYNARFAYEIDYNKNSFIKVDANFDFNKELAIWSEHKVYHNSYLKYNKCYHIILENNEKTYLPTKDKGKVYTFVDKTQDILFKDKWYDLKSIKDYQVKPQEYIKNIKAQEEINLSKAHKPNKDHPWRNVKPITNNLRINIAFSER